MWLLYYISNTGQQYQGRFFTLGFFVTYAQSFTGAGLWHCFA